MPGGPGKLRPEDGKQFSSEYQPKNRRGKLLSTLLKEKLEGDHYVVMSGELLDENKNRTGENVYVRVKLVSKDHVIMALLARAAKGDVRAIDTIFDRLEGKPPQPIDLGVDKLRGRYIEPPVETKKLEDKKDDVKD